MENNLLSRDKWLNSLYQLLITHRDGLTTGLTTDQLTSLLPLSRCQSEFPRYSVIPIFDGRFKLLRNNKLVAIGPGQELDSFLGWQFYEFLRKEFSASSLTQEELLGYFNRWTSQSGRRGSFRRILRAMIRDDLLRKSRSGRYVPQFRDNLPFRMQNALNPNQGGIFVSEIVFDLSSVYLGQGLSSTLTITNNTEYDVYWNSGRLLQEPNVFCLEAIVFPLCIPAGNSIERTVQYGSDAVGNHSNIFLIRIGNFNFIRHCKASTTTDLASRLGPEAPYERRKRKRRNRGLTASVGDRPNRGPQWPVKLKEYLPTDEQNLMANNGLENNLGAMRENMLLNNLDHIDGFVSNYKNLFSTCYLPRKVHWLLKWKLMEKRSVNLIPKDHSIY